LQPVFVKEEIMLTLIIIFLLASAVVVFLTYLSRRKKVEEQEEVNLTINEECCGAHEVCDKDTLLNSSAEIEYFDDEELDVLRGLKAVDYTEAQIQQITDIFETIREDEMAAWLRSLQLRCIDLPQGIRDQALMIVGERRGVQTV
jgi:hypothetical protein